MLISAQNVYTLYYQSLVSLFVLKSYIALNSNRVDGTQTVENFEKWFIFSLFSTQHKKNPNFLTFYSKNWQIFIWEIGYHPFGKHYFWFIETVLRKTMTRSKPRHQLSNSKVEVITEVITYDFSLVWNKRRQIVNANAWFQYNKSLVLGHEMYIWADQKK